MPVHSLSQQTARFEDLHSNTGCAGDGVHNVSGATRELSLWARWSHNASLIAGKHPAVPPLFVDLGRVLYLQASSAGSKAGD